MSKLAFASLVTLSLLTAMVAGVVIAAMVFLGTLDLPAALLLTLVINLILFLLSPLLTDLSLRWINKVAWIDPQDLARRYPHVAALINEVAREHGFSAPSVGIIPDRNPTAFTYGVMRSNARIVVTDGIFEFLNEDETRAVVAHELGHIVHRDFLVMTMAGMLVQMLYQISASLKRRPSNGSSKEKGAEAAATIALASYVLYLIGTYVLLYLSRTREYLADSFSADKVEARHLANALVKIAYGIARAEDTGATRELLAATRHLGVVDFKSARHLGLVADQAATRPEAAAEAMLFDIHNPWARLIELNSTHPLTGHRIELLARIAKEKRQRFDDYDVEAAARRVKLDKGALWSKFRWEVMLLALPLITAVVIVAMAFGMGKPLVAFAAIPAAAAAWLATIPIRYPFSAPQSETVAGLMGDWAASPIVGQPVRLSGEVIGRADAGSIVGEDTVFADPSGRILVDYRSMFAGIGDLWTGWRRIKPHIGAKGEVTGWFVRGQAGAVIMRTLSTTAGTITARPYLRGIATFLIFAVFAVAIAAIVAIANGSW